jgi:tetratricopeptide (TPR) repeat protein
VLVVALIVIGGAVFGGYKFLTRNSLKPPTVASGNSGGGTGQVGLPVPLGNGSTTPPVTGRDGTSTNTDRGSTTIGPHDPSRDHGPTVTRGDQGADLAEQRATELMEDGNFAAAVKEFDRAIATNTNNPLLYQGRAIAKTWTGDLAGAIADYRSLEQLSPRNLEARISRLQLMIATGSHQAALPEAVQTANANPNNCDALVTLGQAQNLCGQVGESQQTFARAAKLDPDAAQRIYDSGFAHLQAGLNQLALIEFIAVAWMDGRYAGAYYGIGRCRVAMGHPPAAIEAYEVYLKYDQRTEYAEHARSEIARLRSGR